METTKLIYTDTEIEQWINKTDPELSIETWESFFPEADEEIDFSLFYERYNKKHLAKFGHKLLIDLE